jgi:hypothetical protein
MSELINPGTYIIPENCIIERKGKELIVRPSKKKKVDGYRCRNCKYFGDGHATDSNYWTTSVCLKKPKTLKKQRTKSQIYFGANPSGKICELFELKDK